MDEDEIELTPEEEKSFFDGIGIIFLDYSHSYLLDLELFQQNVCQISYHFIQTCLAKFYC
jgi:hypothetical protein